MNLRNIPSYNVGKEDSAVVMIAVDRDLICSSLCLMKKWKK